MHSGLAQAHARQRIRESLKAQPELTVSLDSTGDLSSRLRARLLGQEDEKLKIQLTTALGAGMLVNLGGDVEVGGERISLTGHYRVVTCQPVAPGVYHAQLRPESPKQDAEAEKESFQPQEDPEYNGDYYELLQVSRRADNDTIHRVFHVLAQRYHPDNRETGNEDKFRQLAEAHAVLCDTRRRAAYDVKLAAEDKVRFKLFDSLESTQGVQAELRKRQAILRLLYTKRLTDPYSPTMRGREFVDMLGCPMEHLKFSLWFLRENGLILRGDNNKFEITSLGVTTFEEGEGASVGKKASLPRLTAASTPD